MIDPHKKINISFYHLYFTAVGSPCKMDSECVDGSECKTMNITISSFKTCQCREGYMSRDGYCSSKSNS